jgi:hypothetical protein
LFRIARECEDPNNQLNLDRKLKGKLDVHHGDRPSSNIAARQNLPERAKKTWNPAVREIEQPSIYKTGGQPMDALEATISRLVKEWAPEPKQNELRYKYIHRISSTDDLLIVASTGVYTGKSVNLFKDLDEKAQVRDTVAAALSAKKVPVVYLATPLIYVRELDCSTTSGTGSSDHMSLFDHSSWNMMDTVLLEAKQALGPGPSERIAGLVALANARRVALREEIRRAELRKRWQNEIGIALPGPCSRCSEARERFPGVNGCPDHHIPTSEKP